MGEFWEALYIKKLLINRPCTVTGLTRRAQDHIRVKTNIEQASLGTTEGGRMGPKGGRMEPKEGPKERGPKKGDHIYSLMDHQ